MCKVSISGYCLGVGCVIGHLVQRLPCGLDRGLERFHCTLDLTVIDDPMELELSASLFNKSTYWFW